MFGSLEGPALRDLGGLLCLCLCLCLHLQFHGGELTQKRGHHLLDVRIQPGRPDSFLDGSPRLPVGVHSQRQAMISTTAICPLLAELRALRQDPWRTRERNNYGRTGSVLIVPGTVPLRYTLEFARSIARKKVHAP